MNEDYICLTNVKSYYDRTHKDLSMVFYDDFQLLIDEVQEGKYTGEKIVILWDEIFTEIEKNKLPMEVLPFLSQMRKREIIFITTAQEWAEINITLRRYVRYQVNCSFVNIPFMPFSISVNRILDGDNLHWDTEANDFVSDLLKTHIRKTSVAVASQYDTFETISGRITRRK